MWKVLGRVRFLGLGRGGREGGRARLAPSPQAAAAAFSALSEVDAAAGPPVRRLSPLGASC